MDFQSSPLPLPHHIYLDPPQWSQQQEGGGGGGVDIVHEEVHEHGSVDRPAGSMVVRARLAKLPPPEVALKCPRCESINTKFCYFNNYSLSQPRHFCKTCRRYWTRGGALRNVPVGGGCRRNINNKKISKRKRGSKSPLLTISKPPLSNIISDNFLITGAQTPHDPHNLPILPPNLPHHHPLSDQYSLQADVYGMGSGAVGFILGNRFHNIEQSTQLGHDHHFPYMGAAAGSLDPNQLLASPTTTSYNHPSHEIVDHHPLMKVELGNLGLNLLGNINDHQDLDHQYWEDNHNIIMSSSSSNIINNASSAWTDHLSRFGTSSSSTPTTHLM